MAPLSAMAAWRFNSTLERTAPQSMEARLSCFRSAISQYAKQGLQEGLYPQGALHGIGNELVRVFAQLSLVLPPQQLGKVHYHPQRFLQVVRDRIGKMLQFGIGRLECFLGLLAVCCVFNGQKDRPRLCIRIEDLAGVEQHHFPSDMFKFVCHLKVPER